MPLDIQWYFEGQPLKQKTGVTATKIAQRASLLLIDPAGWSHTGTYACIARNAAGLSNYTASLEVHGIPLASVYPSFLAQIALRSFNIVCLFECSVQYGNNDKF